MNTTSSTEMNSSGSATTKSSTPPIMVFRPTLEEMRDFEGYINYMESQGAHHAGIAKIIPPKEWVVKKEGYGNIDNIIIENPICQTAKGSKGQYIHRSTRQTSMSVAEFRALANSKKHMPPQNDLENTYWKNLKSGSEPLYGADVSMSLMDPEQEIFNFNKLKSHLNYLNTDYGKSLDGINTSYLYFGMWSSSFAWHTEDMDLYSINYLHTGSPKFWYGIPPSSGRKFEQLLTNVYKIQAKRCKAFFRHKICLVSPTCLMKNNIPFNSMIQKPGEIMVTFPYGYHAGFNMGFNVAEATNFATARWVEYGKRATRCLCGNPGVVRFSVGVFVRRCQPERFDAWKAGRDIGPHPEAPDDVRAAPKPSPMEIKKSLPKKRKRNDSWNPKKPTKKVKYNNVPQIATRVVNVDIQEVAVNTDNDMDKYSVINITSKNEENVKKTVDLSMEYKENVTNEFRLNKEERDVMSTSQPIGVIPSIADMLVSILGIKNDEELPTVNTANDEANDEDNMARPTRKQTVITNMADIDLGLPSVKDNEVSSTADADDETVQDIENVETNLTYRYQMDRPRVDINNEAVQNIYSEGTNSTYHYQIAHPTVDFDNEAVADIEGVVTNPMYHHQINHQTVDIYNEAEVDIGSVNTVSPGSYQMAHSTLDINNVIVENIGGVDTTSTNHYQIARPTIGIYNEAVEDIGGVETISTNQYQMVRPVVCINNEAVENISGNQTISTNHYQMAHPTVGINDEIVEGISGVNTISPYHCQCQMNNISNSFDNDDQPLDLSVSNAVQSRLPSFSGPSRHMFDINRCRELIASHRNLLATNRQIVESMQHLLENMEHAPMRWVLNTVVPNLQHNINNLVEQNDSSELLLKQLDLKLQ